MIKKSIFSLRKQIRLRPDQVVWLSNQPEGDSNIIRRALDEFIERQEKNKK